MDRAKRLVSTIEHLVSTKTKQHIVGGLLFSISVFLGALATTVLTMNIGTAQDENQNDDSNDEDMDKYEY